MLLCTTSHAFMQARQQADFSEGGFAKIVPFFFFFLFKYFFFCFFFCFYFPLVVPRVGSTSLWWWWWGGGKQWDLPQG